MKSLRSIFLLVVFLMPLAFFTSCGDDEGSVSKTDLLTASAWSFSSLEVPADPTGLTAPFLSLFFTGFRITFVADGTYTIVFPADLDDPNSSGTWEFASSETQIILDKGEDDESAADIITLTDTNLDFTLLFDDEDFGDNLITLKLIH